MIADGYGVGNPGFAFLLSEGTFLLVPHPRGQGAARPLPILGRGIAENVVDRSVEHWLTRTRW
jgi:hypothetical protein